MAVAKPIYQLAHEWGVEVLTLIQLAIAHNTGYTPSEEGIEILKRAMSGYYDLTDPEIRELDDFLCSDKAEEVLQEAASLIGLLDGKEQEKYIAHIAKRLFAQLPDGELKRRIKPETIYETIMNLGIVNIYRSSGESPEEKALPLHLLRFDDEIAQRVVKRHFIKTLERRSVDVLEDFSRAKNALRSEYDRMMAYASERGADPNLEQMVGKAFMGVSAIADFGRRLWEGSVGATRPKMHQLIRIHEAVMNGHRRILCADTTSAGKTLTAVAIKGLMDRNYQKEKGRKARALVIAPNQAIPSAWSEDEINRYTGALQLPNQRSARIEMRNIDSLLGIDFILVNYDVLSHAEKGTNVKAYLSAITDILPFIDLIVVDECHNLKNIESNRAREFMQLVEKTKGKNFVMLSASPIPNRLGDAGFLLYMLDPVRYGHYARNPFDYAEDRFSIRNAMNSGAWFTFGRGDIKALFGLPELRFEAPELRISRPHYFEMSAEDARRYFEVWQTDTGSLEKIHPLSKILLQSELSEIEGLCRRITENEPDAQIGVFSFHTEGFTKELKERLSRLFPDKVEMITGTYPAGMNTQEQVEKRVEMARRFNRGELRVLINTISTVSEAISLITEDRPAYIIFAEPPVVPANFEQAIGRFYRIGQKAPVTVIELVPQNEKLNEWMENAQERQRAEGVRYRKSWRPGTIFLDRHDLRQDKIRLLELVLHGKAIDDLIEIANISEGARGGKAYATIPPDTEEEKGSVNRRFNEGLKGVRSFIGRPVEELVKSNARWSLVSSYASEDLQVTSSGDTGRAIVDVIKGIEEKIGKRFRRILDWGCGTACLARAIKRQVYNLDAIPEMIAIGKERCAESGIYNAGTIDDYFHVGNATKMPFPERMFDVVSSSYAIQYNAQGYRHRRDIERILLETNRVLRKGGYGILALANQATSPQDIQVLEKILLPRYGFAVIYSDDVTGHAVNDKTGRENKVFQGFHLIVYQKEEDKDAFVGESADVFVYSPYKRLGIGGRREIERLEGRGCAEYKSSKLPATTFKTSDGSLLQRSLKKVIRK